MRRREQKFQPFDGAGRIGGATVDCRIRSTGPEVVGSHSTLVIYEGPVVGRPNRSSGLSPKSGASLLAVTAAAGLILGGSQPAVAQDAVSVQAIQK
jgi:hypothetical protein